MPLPRSAALLLVCLTASGLANAQPTPLIVQLDWKPTAQFAGLLVAKQLGFYAKEGLEVTILPADDQMQTVQRTASHANWIGVSESEGLLIDRARGNDVKAFATMLQTTPFSLFTLKSSGLTTFASLKGRRIGLYGDGQKAIDVLLAYNHMTRADVTLVTIPYTTDDLVQGKVDAMQGYAIDEGVRLEMEHHPVNVIPMSENGYSSYAEVLFAPTPLIREHPDQLVRFLSATAAGWDYAAAHPEDTVKIILRNFAPDASAEEQRITLQKVLPMLHAESPHFGQMSPATWAAAFRMCDRYHLAPPATTLPPSGAVDYSITKALYP